MSLFTPSLPALLRRAEQAIEHAASPQAAPPRVLWQASGEFDDAFDRRVSVARARLPRTVAIVAVCGPRSGLRLDGVRWVELPPKLLSLLNPVTPARYRVGYSGRGAGKSWAFGRALIARALAAPVRILCAREFQGSILESVHRLLSSQITELGLDPWFAVQQTSIVGANGSEFIFAGLHHNVSKIKSTEGIDICFIEEGERISEESWQVLIPTVRKPSSEIWCSFNPDAETDPTFQRFAKSPPPGALVAFLSWRDNPWFPRELDAEREYLARVDPDAYAWIWEGQTRAASDAQIFRSKYSVAAFEPGAEWGGPYYGADWGFAQDPTTLVRCWINDRKLYVEYEAYGVGVDIDRTPALFEAVPGARNAMIRADSARPETISFMRRNGYPNITGVEKWSGSVEDGIAHLRSYEQIVIHPRCSRAVEEMRLYSYKTDRLTGDIKPEPKDANNHVIDALRYAVSPLIRLPKGMGLFEYYRREAAKLDHPKMR